MSLRFSYWGKRGKGPEGHWHHLCHHCLDVAAVVEALLLNNATWRTRLYALSPYPPELTQALLLFLAACHDLGKFADGFQFCLPEETVWEPPLGRDWRHSPFARHTALGLGIWHKLRPPKFLPLPGFDMLKPLAAAALAHHGEPNEPIAPRFLTLKPEIEVDIKAFLQELAVLFHLAAFPEPASSQNLNRLSCAAAGLFILADWIASNERRVVLNPHWAGAEAYFPQAQRLAKQALEDLPFLKEIAPNRRASGFHALLPHLDASAAPSPMQQAVLGLPEADGPELLIIEDLTGGGKTEAALLAVHRLLRDGQGSGLYIGLPTTATADAMYGRLAAGYQALFAERVPLLLTHGATALNEDFQDSILPDGKQEENGAATCAQWLADNRKKALLCPCGVGTIDQALMAALQTRHQALRLFGLCRSVFVGDEVHAFDAYTGTLLQNLLRVQAALGGSAVLLSATLTQRQRRDFVQSWNEGRKRPTAEPEVTNFPLLTRVTDKECREKPVEAQRALNVRVRLAHEENDMYEALAAAAGTDACACWVRNTVGDVCMAYRRLTEAYDVHPDKVLVFHARFTGLDRHEIEREVLRHFGKNSGPGQRAGRIVLASQVVEQSLDLDFDLLLSDLAPMDLLIQRAGRCHRHDGRLRPEAYAHPLMLVLSPRPTADAGANWYAEMFKAGQRVYHRHALLWRTARLLELEGCLRLPERARFLMERADGNDEMFPDEPQVVAPGTLDDREFKADGEDLGKRAAARFNQLNMDGGYLLESGAWPSDSSAPTRLGEPAQNVCLLRLADGALRLWAGGEARNMRSCLLSELRVRQHQLCAAVNPPECENDLKALVQEMPDKGNWCLCLVVRKAGNDVWEGQGMNENGQHVTVRYSRKFGLEIATE